MSFLKASPVLLVALFWLVGCATGQPYLIKSDQPNLTVQIQMEDKFFVQEIAELSVYEVRGTCERLDLGYLRLKAGLNSVTLPVGRDLIIEFVRVNAAYDNSMTNRNEDTIRLRPQPRQLYHLRLRERSGSREVQFTAKSAGQTEFRDFAGSPIPKCEKLHFIK